MQVNDDDNLHGSQRSNGVKYSKLSSMATNLVRRSLMTMMTCIEVKGRGNLCNMATTFGQMYR